MKRLLACILILLCVHASLFSQDTEKSIVAVLDLNGDGASAAEMRAITNLLISSIYETDLVKVIDRNQREEVLSEIAFSLTGCTDESCAIEVGKLLAADIMIIGSIERIGSRLTIDLKAVDVATSSLLGTYNQVFSTVDDIVDGIDTIGGQFVQNFTGLLAAKKSVLQYETLVPLHIACDVEDASVFINGDSVGKISDGSFTKALNIDAAVQLDVIMEGYYPYSEGVIMDREKEITVTLTPLVLKKAAFKADFGGGIMGSFYYSQFLKPNWIFLDIGAGFTITSTDPLLVNLPVSLKLGKYLFYDDRSIVRPYAGGMVIYNAFAWYDYDTFIVRPADLIWFGLNFGAYGGAEIKLNDHIRVHGDISLFINKIWQGMLHIVQLGIGVTVM